MRRILTIALASAAIASTAQAVSVSVPFAQLTGTTGGSPAETGVWVADLTSVGISDLLSITISDNSGGLGGATGQFSGFDLDGIKLSNTLVANAAAAAALPGLSVFDFVAGTLFAPGTQRPPVDAKLFGTDAAGTDVDNSVATLGFFDGNSTTGPTADGFLSMGDNGKIAFNLTSSVSTTGLYLYIGEVGDNGEIAAGSIEVSDQRTNVPDSGSTAALFFLGCLAGFALRKRLCS